ncbi:Pimeloyl-ACP methyl ester carboxylesterase [Marinobacter daqiaonensis]|uniref:Pimeloyl-ACP methyl ester carboxylesterase n=1 Tax=Marinobacter daqiaonensis TaxID=650891 RepID=A0A1I6IDB7_9GAMM|nr:alpha/beta hydrolase [Marinobacter daqiaonensis]SFR64767.1 Pimeloyl-ACP methyl ester carboxylesterase [Marinobacter daqiaonensis]
MTTIREQFLDIAGARVYVKSWTPEPATGVPLVLLHDSLGCVELWRDFPSRLADHLGRQVIAYDRPGFGQSSARHELPSRDFIRKEAEDVFPELCRALGLGQYSLFGHSVGGAMALEIAAQDPDGCQVVITEAAQAFVEQRTLEGIRQAGGGFKDPAQFSRLGRYHGDKARWVLAAWTDTWLSPGFADWSLEPVLTEVHCPVLAIHGDQDEYGSLAFPERITKGVSGPSRQVVLEGCGHVPHRERPEAVLEAITKFID